MIESHVTGPVTGLGDMLTTAAQRNFKLARQHPGTNQCSRKSAPLLDTPLSSSSVLANSTRHSVTSRIECNSRLLCYLTFSTRHLNATPKKRNLVEKFNTSLRSDFAPETRVPEPIENRHASARKCSCRPPVPSFRFRLFCPSPWRPPPPTLENFPLIKSAPKRL